MKYALYGRQPSATVGESLPVTSWSWTPTAEMLAEIAPDIVGDADTWLDPDDDTGLDQQQATALADRLAALLADGTIDAYIEDRERRIEQMPGRPCADCDGTGRIAHPHPTADRTRTRLSCIRCAGSRTIKPISAYQVLDRTFIQSLADFARHSGCLDAERPH